MDRDCQTFLLHQMCHDAGCSVEISYRPEGRRWKWLAFISHCPGKPDKPIYGETLEDLLARCHAAIDWTKAVRS